MVTSIRDELAMCAIREDAAFVGRYISAQQRHANQSFAPTLAFCMGSYLALFIYEGRRALQAVDGTLAGSISTNAEQIMTRSRHSLKFFDDTRRGLEGVRNAFGQEIIPAHRDYFAGLLRFKWMEPLATDLGIFRYNGRIVSTTHAATFSLGLEARALADGDVGALVRGLSEEYGGYFGRLGARFDAGQTCFPVLVDANKTPRREEDRRSADFYPQVFNGARTPDLNAALVMMLGHLNFVTDVVASIGSREYTTFKIRFLALYQVLRSLAILRDEQPDALTAQSLSAVNSVLQRSAAANILHDRMRPLRNTLVHYNLDSRLDPTVIDTDDLSFSLTAATLGKGEADHFLVDFENFLPDVAHVMNDWMEQ